jgi:hypothetical protein
MDAYIPRNRYTAALIAGLGLLGAMVVTTACDDNNLELQITNSEFAANLEIEASGPSFSFTETLPVESPATLFRSVDASAGDMVSFTATVAGTTVATATCTVDEAAFDPNLGNNTASVLVLVSQQSIVCGLGWVSAF